MNVLLVGEESAGAQTLKLLLSSPHHLVGVLASSSRRAVGGMTVWQHAEKNGCRTWPAESVKDPAFADVVRAEKVDLILNVHSLFVIKPEIVEAPRYGSFNLHPGPLPRYAGLNAPSWAIYKGEKAHGVTLHRMLADIDTGPIAYQALFDIEDKDTGFSVSAKCIRHGMDLIRSLLEVTAEDPCKIPVIEQDFSKREYFGKGTPENGWLAWSRPAREIFNFVRAADYSPFKSPWLIPRARLGEQEVAFVKVTLTGEPGAATPGMIARRGDGQIFVSSSDEWLYVNRIMINGQLTNPAHFLTPGEHLEWEN